MSRFLKSLIVVPGVVVCLGSFAHADAITESRDAALAQTSVYRVGYPVEVSIKSGKGLGKNQFAANTEASKHYALGRLSHELSYVMPDSRTVYIGNDQKNGGLFRFVA
ncbi:alkaline phosphatase PhoX, partial [Falsihalocynthiibacter sp. BN13B15]|uniref:alkaline phosphatase PhoX n=1 Tax=Falsihalocynthiibacter sp. BN13B15 TaxID=3240871 RepID=UPI0035108624